MTLLSPIENGSAHQGGARLSRRALGFALALLLALPLGAPARAFADVRGTDEILGASVEARGLPAVVCPNVTASFALVMDDEGTVLFSRGALERSHIASITKIMTAIVALDSGVPLDSTVTVSQEAAQVGESSASLWAGDTLTLEAALAGLMIPSGNDAAIAIAETLGEGMKTDDSQTANEAFVAAMNAKAAELGMTETLFSNPHGLDIGAYDNEMYSCARDVALMSAYAMGNETFRSIVSKESAQITVTRADGKPQVIDLQSTDRLLGTYEGACGIKTGYTEAAGNSFAGACDRGDGLLYAIVLGSPSEDARFQDTETLFDWVYDNRVSYALAHSPETVAFAADGGAEVPLIARVSQSAWPDPHRGGHLRRSLGRRRGVRARGQCEPGDRRRGADRFGGRGGCRGRRQLLPGQRACRHPGTSSPARIRRPPVFSRASAFGGTGCGATTPRHRPRSSTRRPSSTASHPLARIISPLRPSPQASQTTLPPTVPEAARARVPQTPPTSKEVGHERALPRLFPRDFTERHRVSHLRIQAARRHAGHAAARHERDAGRNR